MDKLISHDDYIELISIDYHNKFSIVEVENIIEKYIDYSKYYKNKILEMINIIIKQHENTGELLRELYDMYCHGCDFLFDLGLEYGLRCEVPPKANSWDDLSSEQKRELVNSFYPRINDFAIEVRQWLENGTVKVLGYDKGNLKYIVEDEPSKDTNI
ncbi:hypothetical protein [Oceanirhabdus sp. W0125-5]|uniref:hypothetical protein n=1 Tax=Oceanirhabdus sp. W0125-5 TaxID=2999116 RepID=UPI0022F2E243|nr:hypothetical protein [Oceanirhabdus sp. W0125-5]WBW99488.1 hypothetical protein OW730_12290 [Oceanirhabdus sp. W0125-5]